MSLFPWVRFRKTKKAIKLHTLLDLHRKIKVGVFRFHELTIIRVQRFGFLKAVSGGDAASLVS
ncbi:MAG: hypothetical protein DRP87_08800 [Spirochaetes bacterium]|nr:MAG: hypothetical protein DRP87_08800 [Spirochaetota bacterium]